ncbi:unnamed protein product [Spirodela intermedia]|uniref:Uncharacterized protein n=2 Tax=Spirodela intermedia TaxID=51605 RepID=A0A7I8LLG4_SPIIN|nr:unnamed protein product [Spirodela intermedia]CAA6673682.1 unnamed protein product [Spirodela intermedia]CAA7410923.1 unnamed protein product [Spirodela intermedia]
MAMKNHYILDSFQRASNIRVPLAPTVKFEINLEIFQMLPNFHRLPLEKPHQHLEKFHMVCDLVNLLQVTLEIIKMKLFPHTLRDKAKQHRNIIDYICGGAFMKKTPDEIYNLYENLSENSRDQASFELYDKDKKRGIYELHYDDDSKLIKEVN